VQQPCSRQQHPIADVGSSDYTRNGGSATRLGREISPSVWARNEPGRAQVFWAQAAERQTAEFGAALSAAKSCVGFRSAES
jgi:hypothetical protein